MVHGQINWTGYYGPGTRRVYILTLLGLSTSYVATVYGLLLVNSKLNNNLYKHLVTSRCYNCMYINANK